MQRVKLLQLVQLSPREGKENDAGAEAPHALVEEGLAANERDDWEGAARCFALAYAHKQLHLIPDNVPEVGYADESSVVRTVLIENEKVLSEYAKRHGLDWGEITTKA